MTDLFASPSDFARTARLVTASGLEAELSRLSDASAAHARASGFEAGPGQVVMLPGEAGLDALVGAGAGLSPFDAAGAALALPEGDWAYDGLPEGWDATQTAIAFALGGYQFTRYKSPKRAPARLVTAQDCDVAEAERVAKGVMLTRDLINTPAGDMLPSHLEDEARKLAEAHGASVSVITGDDLLAQNYPMIHAVGRAATDAPRLIEFEWGDESHPRLTLVGKGVCFDSGGLDIKPADGMLLMKKDMGGSATVLGLASMIMDAKLPVRLHVLIPAVENAIAGNAFRPGDILTSRKGLTVEVGNTDAEGRLVLADAITRACESDPELLIDMATLTGAARVAMGPDVAPFYTDVDAIAEGVAEAGAAIDDPVWRLPLWNRYDEWLDSPIADLSSTGSGRFAGSITAGLFLRRFGSDAKEWAHFDIFGWTPAARPGRPQGGEMLAGRAVYAYLKTRFGA
ncbi:MAG: leucyl aminopeptidase [Oceanicaulis sp.]|mgnify:FL=1|uniref:leucyl aminopeptidase family protein n=1 Tax=Oceanicaulis sp. UBA2681 TaxID=1947007 RepID=UPI000C0AAFAB|nr:leucyl aminopeptidase family protein [Oceanicaulis sp. UBA2681]MAP48070.1 leucyl aminopeptidase [Oceanicaulis sp.]